MNDLWPAVSKLGQMAGLLLGLQVVEEKDDDDDDDGLQHKLSILRLALVD
jgi:hypothetical protein